MSKSKIELIVVPVVLFFGSLYVLVLVVRANRFEALALNFSTDNLRRINTALKDYATNASGRMPDATDWADQVVAGQSCVLRADFITSFSHPGYGVFFNAAYGGCDIAAIEANSVVLFACAGGQWNASGTRETFSRLSSKGKSYIVTWDSDVYEYDSVRRATRRLNDNASIELDDLMWSKREPGGN